MSALQIVIDCADCHAMADFWAQVLGYEVEQVEAGIRELMAAGIATDDDVTHRNGALVWKTGSAMSDPSGARNRFYFQNVPEPKTVKNRMHIDIQVGPAARDAEVERILALGATHLYDGDQGPHHWATLADIEGNEFCVS
jgi:hypothetical protein